MENVKVQKFQKGLKVNKPFGMKKDRAERLVKAHGKDPVTTFEIVGESVVAPIKARPTVETVTVQKKSQSQPIKNVAAKSEVTELPQKAKDAIRVISKTNDKELLKSWYKNEKANDNRKTVLTVLNKAISE